MLSGLRAGAPIYIFDKNKPSVSIGEVISVSNPVQQYGMTYTPTGPVPPAMVVDVRAKVDGVEINFTKMPATATIADFGQSGMVVSENLDATLHEIEAFQKVAQRKIDETERNKEIVSKCEEMKLYLNPQARKEVEQSKELAELRGKVSDLSGQLEQMNGLLAQLLSNKATKKKEE